MPKNMVDICISVITSSEKVLPDFSKRLTFFLDADSHDLAGELLLLSHCICIQQSCFSIGKSTVLIGKNLFLNSRLQSNISSEIPSIPLLWNEYPFINQTLSPYAEIFVLTFEAYGPNPLVYLPKLTSMR